LSTLKTGAAWQ